MPGCTPKTVFMLNNSAKFIFMYSNYTCGFFLFQNEYLQPVINRILIFRQDPKSDVIGNQ